MKFRDFDYIYKMVEEEIEVDNVEIEEGKKPSVAELLDFYLRNSDYIFRLLFKDCDESGRDITCLADLTEDELEQIDKLRNYCKN